MSALTLGPAVMFTPADRPERYATALERAAPSPRPPPETSAADAFLWGPERRLVPVTRVNRVEIKGIDPPPSIKDSM